MRWLKTLVIGMGAVIVIGLTVVIVKVAQRARAPSPSAVYSPMPPVPPVIGAPAPAPTPTVAPARTLGDINIAIPPGATAEEIEMDRARVVVRLRLSDGTAALLLIDAATGRKLGLITLDGRRNDR